MRAHRGWHAAFTLPAMRLADALETIRIHRVAGPMGGRCRGNAAHLGPRSAPLLVAPYHRTRRSPCLGIVAGACRSATVLLARLLWRYDKVAEQQAR